MSFEIYKPRKIEFYQLVDVNSYQIKVYTITCCNEFESKEVLDKTLANLSEWLPFPNFLALGNHQIGFLIVHEGQEGIWALINCWIGGDILQSKTFYTSYDASHFETTPKEGFMACVWEMEVICFERAMWVEYILKKAQKPDFTGYLNERLNGGF